MPIIKVEEERWEYAQREELSCWVREIRQGANNDWNDWWAKQFNNYDMLPKEMACAIELGCGPFTNMRMILENHEIDMVFLEDPLLDEYVVMDCWVSDALTEGSIVPVFAAIEKMDHIFEDKLFDLVVMINVLDHVMDAEKCVKQAKRICKGHLVIGQDLSNEQDEAHVDSMHPIKVDEAIMDKWLQGFKPIMRQILSREEGRSANHCGTLLYVGVPDDNPAE